MQYIVRAFSFDTFTRTLYICSRPFWYYPHDPHFPPPHTLASNRTTIRSLGYYWPASKALTKKSHNAYHLNDQNPNMHTPLS